MAGFVILLSKAYILLSFLRQDPYSEGEHSRPVSIEICAFNSEIINCMGFQEMKERMIFFPGIPEGGKMSKKRTGKSLSVKKRPDSKRRARANTHYKDTVFRMLFRDKEQLMGLYNAVGGRRYRNPESLEIITLEGTIYMGMKNDLAFLIDFNLYLFEHQSTINVNMPLRFLQYVTAEYGKLTASDNLYSGSLVRIPAPHFVVFYNGLASCPEKQELKLSEAFQIREEEPELELRVRILNINHGFNEELKKQCRTLGEYMQYVDKVRTYVRELSIDDAVDRAVDECIEQNVLREFLLRNKAEVRRMSIYEYNEEDTRRAIREYEREQGRIEGKAEGKAEDILLLLEEKGEVSVELQKEIMAEGKEEILKEWLKIAVKVESVDEFMIKKRSVKKGYVSK